MSEPEFLVDHCKQGMDLAPFLDRNPAFKNAREVKCSHILLPEEKEPVVSPAALDFDGKLICARTLVSPIIGSDNFLHQV